MAFPYWRPSKTAEVAKAVYLQIGFQKWHAVMLRNKMVGAEPTDEQRSAFIGGALFAQMWAGPASVKLDS